MAKVDDLVDAEDWGGLIALAIGAWNAAARGEFCRCETPDVVGRDLMCAACNLEVKAQRERREREMSEPHPYEPMPDRDFGMCGFCSRWEDDPLHEVLEENSHE